MEDSRNTHTLYIVMPALLLIGGIVGLFAGTHYAQDTIVYDYQFDLETPNGEKASLQYGIWPELGSVDFYEKVQKNSYKKKQILLKQILPQ